MSRHGYRVRVTYPALFEYRYLVKNAEGWHTTDRFNGRIFKTPKQAQEAIPQFLNVVGIPGVQCVVDPVPEFDPDWTVPTGEHIKEQLDVLGISREAFTERMGLTAEKATELLEGNEPLTQELVETLVTIVRGGVEYWLKLESNYREGLKRGLHVTK